jgi:hypothetical protein
MPWMKSRQGIVYRNLCINEYKNKSDSVTSIESIKLECVVNENPMRAFFLRIQFLTSEQVMQFSSKLRANQLISNCTAPARVHTLIISEQVCIEVYDSVQELVPKFLNCIRMLIKEDPQVVEISDGLCRDFGILALSDINNKPVSEAIDFVLNAQKVKNYFYAEQLLFYYWRTGTAKLTDIYNFAVAIDERNPCYAQAHDLCVKILTLQAPCLFKKMDQSSLDVDKHVDEALYFENLEKRFCHALKGTNPELTDSLFSLLCNDHWDMPDIPNIKGDPNTLLAVAKKFRKQPTIKPQCSSPVEQVSPKSYSIKTLFTLDASQSTEGGSKKMHSATDRSLVFF